MGMFDYILCDYPLPGPGKTDDLDKCDLDFQTKDLDSCLETYTIREDGVLTGPDGRFKDFTGTLNFYWSNWSAVHYGMTFTSDGSDLIELEYDATFVNGKLTTIVEVENSRTVTLPSSFMRTLEDEPKVERPENYFKESLLNRRVFIQYGGNAEGFWATIIAETPKYFVYLQEGVTEPQPQNIHRWDRGRLMFDSEEESVRVNAEWQRRREMNREACEKALAEKRKERQG